MTKHSLGAVSAILLTLSTTAAAAPQVFEASGASPEEIQGTVDAFRDALGNLNDNVVGSFPDGRRQIDWDGVGDDDAAPNPFPPNFFNDVSPRGVVFFTPGKGFQVSADSDNPTHTDVEFGNIRKIFPRLFTTFSPERLFTPLDSNIVEVLFFEPGLPQSATTDGFGAVFTDVDKADSTKIEYFDVDGNLLFSKNVLKGTARRESLSFLGVMFDEGEEVFLVRITSGNRPLGKGGKRSFGRGSDEVVMDDFIFGEPQPQVTQ